MAGILPGVKAARRRRIHHGGGGGGVGGGGWPDFKPGGSAGGHGWTRRPGFCLFVGSFEPNPICSSSVFRSRMNRTCQDEKLGQLAREAKERLDERLRAQRTSQIERIERNNSDPSEERSRCADGRRMMIRELQTEVFGSNKKLMMMKLASKLGGWKASSEQQECAVCLDQFKLGDNLVKLPCAHRFHSSCLLPWLQTHVHCPCCRTTILP